MANGLKGMYEAIRNYGAQSGSGDRRAVALKELEKHRTDSGKGRGEADLFSGMLDAQATGGQTHYKPSDFVGKSGRGLGNYGGDYTSEAGGRMFGGEGSRNIEGNVFEHFKNNPQDFYNYYENFGKRELHGDSARETGKYKVRRSLQRGMESYLGDDYDSWWDQNVTRTGKAYNEGRNMFRNTKDVVEGEFGSGDVRDLVGTVSKYNQSPQAKYEFDRGLEMDDMHRQRFNMQQEHSWPSEEGWHNEKESTWEDLGDRPQVLKDPDFSFQRGARGRYDVNTSNRGDLGKWGDVNEGVYKREHGKGFRTKDPRIEEAGY